MCFDRASLAISVTLLVLGLVTPAIAGPRMYMGSLVIHAFGNDATTGAHPPLSTVVEAVGIPLTGHCNTLPHHPMETLVFPTTPTGSQVFTVTIPAYGGAVKTIDTNGDTLPDLVPGCGDATLQSGNPLTGIGPVNTTGASTTSRTANDPRGFTLPQWAMRKNSEASLEQYGVYLWEVQFADLHNSTGVFAKGGGDGSFVVEHTGQFERRMVAQAAGKNQFGGVMRLLGSYDVNYGYAYAKTAAYRGDWLVAYLGAGGQATVGGVVTAGYAVSGPIHGYTISSGYRVTSTVSHEVFKWTTGTVTVTALSGTFPTLLQRKGTDQRTPMGSGTVQLVSPMLTRWLIDGSLIGGSTTAGIGILKVQFVPEPSRWLMLGSGLATLGLLAHRRSKRARR